MGRAIAILRRFARRANQFGVRKTIAVGSTFPGGQNRMRQNAIFARGLNVIGAFKTIAENISLFQKINSGVWSAHPAAARGAYRDRHGRRQRDAMDAGSFTGRVLLPRTAKARGPDLPTLGSSFAVSRCRPYRTDTLRSARRRWLKSPVHRGERADRPLTPIAQGRQACFGGPVVTNACAFYTARAAAGAQNTRPSLRPLSFRGLAFARPGHIVPR